MMRNKMMTTRLNKLIIGVLVALISLSVIAAEEIQSVDELKIPELGRADPFESILKTAVEHGEMSVKAPLGPPAEIISDEELGDYAIKTVMLKFLRAQNLQSLVAGMLSSRGTVGVDTETNSLIICDTTGRISSILTQIQQADQTPKQVMIEVVIADVRLSDDEEIGVNWNNLFGDAESVGLSGSQVLVDSFSTTLTASSGMDLTFLQNDISVTLHALQQIRDIEILASPRVLVVSGQEAEIKTVEEIPYEEQSDTSEGGSLTSTEFKEVGVTLNVKATVTDENKVQMTITPSQSVKTGDSVNDVPIVDKREARTTLLVNDGQVIVMGGLRRKEILQSNDKVPLLGDIPLLGLLFTRENRQVLNSELLVFICPHIESGYTPTVEQMQRFNELREEPMMTMPDKTPWTGQVKKLKEKITK